MNKLLTLFRKIEIDRKKALLVIFLCLLIVYFDFRFFMANQLNILTAAGLEIDTLKNNITALNNDLVRMNQSKANQAVLLKSKQFISEGQLPELLKNISTLANQSGVRIMEIKPLREGREEVQAGLMQESDEAAVASGKGTGKLIPVQIALDLACGYHQLGGFISALENDKQFMGVKELKVTRDDTNYLIEKIALTLQTYVKQ